MGRSVNEARITTPNARSKLPASKTVRWRAIDRGTHLGYRKSKDGGTWIARHRLEDGQYRTGAIGKADDNCEADGVSVLSCSQALERARAWCQQQDRLARGIGTAGPYRVRDAMAGYFEWFKLHRKSVAQTQDVARLYILPVLGHIDVAKLTMARVRQWHHEIASSPARVRSSKTGPVRYRDADGSPEATRKRKSTANRVLTVLKAALNHAYHDGNVTSDEAWKRVKPFRGVDKPVVRYLSADECVRLINACDADFRKLVQAALLTGCRYGELIRLKGSDFNSDAGTVSIREAKSGRARHVPLNDEGIAFFEGVTAGRGADDLIFSRADGKPWGKSHQKRRLEDAARKVGISDVSFHILRHTYASILAMHGVPMGVIAAVLGHADTRMTERHYAALAPNYVADTIRAHLPALGIQHDHNVALLRANKFE